MNVTDKLKPKNHDLQRFINPLRYLFRRVDEEQLTHVAGNITYALILGLVPTIAVVLAIFTKLPQFGNMEKMVHIYFTRGMIPLNMAESITGYLTTFANKAGQVSLVSSIAMVFTTAMMFDLIETTFNRIWGVQEPRSIIRRVIIYIFIATLGPLLMGGSLYLSSYLYLAARGVVGQLPYLKGIWSIFFLGGISTVAFTLMYRCVPYRHILWKDAFWGGLFAAIAFEIAKRLFAIFIVQFASYQKIYGAIALIPMFFLWLYVSSLIMLLGAVLTSSLPDFRSGRWRRVVTPGSQFSDALFLIRTLYDAQREKNTAVDWVRLQRLASLNNAELEGILLTMQKLGWVVHIQRHPGYFMGRKIKSFSRSFDEWKWITDATQITLGDIYKQFVFKPDEDDPLSAKINQLIKEGLNQTLVDYFHELEKDEPLMTIPGFS